ncbi:MAG: hypothetical protein ACKOOA_05325, partial [Sediminibacterium sp.]
SSILLHIHAPMSHERLFGGSKIINLSISFSVEILTQIRLSLQKSQLEREKSVGVSSVSMEKRISYIAV